MTLEPLTSCILLPSQKIDFFCLPRKDVGVLRGKLPTTFDTRAAELHRGMRDNFQLPLESEKLISFGGKLGSTAERFLGTTVKGYQKGR